MTYIKWFKFIFLQPVFWASIWFSVFISINVFVHYKMIPWTWWNLISAVAAGTATYILVCHHFSEIKYDRENPVFGLMILSTFISVTALIMQVRENL